MFFFIGHKIENSDSYYFSFTFPFFLVKYSGVRAMKEIAIIYLYLSSQVFSLHSPAGQTTLNYHFQSVDYYFFFIFETTL